MELMNYMMLLLLLILMMMMCLSSFLLILTCFEFLLILILHSYLMVEMIMNNDWIFLLILIMGVCESVIGLSLMISIIYLYGNQSMKFLNLMW
uniref:NADH dehydrogenase subunit 4L n=1 Tax=Nomia chalybeata TaxID=2448184 RepID=A0A7L8EYE7_9HYME|nr:NADH dehydrogenase subunit 4L [Nomia chalybeata]QOE17508.1 NADH dehydrogenase subunit 4L [Nomia chalybeata]